FLVSEQARGSIRSFNDSIAVGLQHGRTQLADAILIVHEQDGFRTAARPRDSATVHRLDHFLGARQINLEYRTAIHLAIHGDLAAVLPHNSIHDGKAESGSLALTLCGKERLEQPGPRTGVHADTSVADGHHDVRARLEADAAAVFTLLQNHIAGFDQKFAATRHRVARVHGQIHDDLL